jgi:hypothetical protein
MVLAVAALGTALVSTPVAVVLGVAAIVCAALAWMRSDPSVGGGRTLAGWSLVITLLAGILGLADNAVDAHLSDADPTPAVVTPVGDESQSTSDVVVGDLAVSVAAPARHASSPVDVPVTVTNVGSTTQSFVVHLRAVDAEGRTVATDTLDAPALAAGKTRTLHAFTHVDAATADAVRAAKVQVGDVDQS